MFKTAVSKLHLRDVGVLELLFAFTPILVRYALPGLPFSFLMPLLMIFYSVLKAGRLEIAKCEPIMLFLAFFLIHQVAWVFVMDKVPEYFLNSCLSNFVYIFTILVLGKALCYRKMVGSINWVAILSVLGMFYHFSIALRGGEFTPLNLPFLGGLDTGDWLHRDAATRPMSFFSEPAVYVSFILMPLFIAMIENNYLWAGVLILSIFMSSSTTGLVLAFLIVAFFVFTQKMKSKYRILVIALMGVMAFVITQTSFFEQGTEKLVNTDVEATTRTAQGPLVVSSMKPKDFVLGVPYADAYDYCIHNSIGGSVVYYGNAVYMATFWLVILTFGIIGLFFYLNIYWHFIKNNRLLIPFILCLVATFFSSAVYIGSSFCIQFCFILAFHYYSVRTGLVTVKQKKHGRKRNHTIDYQGR